MDDVTDTVFRRIVSSLAPPDLSFTEFVNVDGLQSPGRRNLLPKLALDVSEGPVIAQVWGKNPENYRKTAKELVDMGFAGIDINMGCPIKTIVNNNCCSALINDRNRAVEIIQAVQNGAENKVPVSVKTRLGFNSVDLTWHELLLQQKLDALTIHGRTKKELSSVAAHWDEIGIIRQMRDTIAPNTKIIGNGDVLSKQQGMLLAEQYMLDGIMIGRGVFADPLIFSKQSQWLQWTREKRILLFKDHIRLFLNTWKRNERKLHTLNKFCKVYIAGFDGAKELRELFMECNTPLELDVLLENALMNKV